MTDLFRVDGKVAVVVGGAGGIGQIMVLGLAQQGADVAIADLFLIKGLRIVDGKNGMFVGMPHELGKNGQWYQTVLTLNEEFKSQLEEIVLEAYQQQ